MKLRNFFVGAGALLLILFSGVFLNTVMAQSAADKTVTEKQEIAISPNELEIETVLGASSTGNLKIVNTSKAAVNYKIYAKPYSLDDAKYFPDSTKDGDRSSAYRWVDFGTKEGQLDPGQEQEITYIFSVPIDAKPGRHYSVVFAETVPVEKKKSDYEEDENKKVVVKTQRVGMLVGMTVDGKIIKEGETKSIWLPTLWWQSALEANVKVANTGNVDLEAKTGIIVRSIFGRELHSEQRNNLVLPGYQRTIDYSWGGGLRAGIYKVEVSSDVLGKKTTVAEDVILAPALAIAAVAVVIISIILFLAYRLIVRYGRKL